MADDRSNGAYWELLCYFVATSLATWRELLRSVESYRLPQSPANELKRISDNPNSRRLSWFRELEGGFSDGLDCQELHERRAERK